jgi:hypothetical protein
MLGLISATSTAVIPRIIQQIMIFVSSSTSMNLATSLPTRRRSALLRRSHLHRLASIGECPSSA